LRNIGKFLEYFNRKFWDLLIFNFALIELVNGNGVVAIEGTSTPMRSAGILISL